MGWELIKQLLGPGLHWGMSQEHFLACIKEAERVGDFEAAGHLHIMLERRNRIMCESLKKTPQEAVDTPEG